MLRFFRKMRNALLAENRFTRYFFYAVGEIILVVIGILIALQINTWNQNRINRKTEKDYLVRLSNEIKADTAYFNSLKNLLDKKGTSLKRILKIWQKNVPVITDSLQYINDFISAGDISSWYIEPVTWAQLVQTGDLKLFKDQMLIDKLYRYYNSIKRIADNYNQHPMQMTNEARRRWHEPFLQENPNEYMHGNLDDYMTYSYKVIPHQVVFGNIWENRNSYQELFSALAFISMSNKRNMQGIINDGTEILEILNKELSAN